MKVSVGTLHGRVIEYWLGKHPFFPGEKWVMRARRILAERIGRPLTPDEAAHHKNGVVTDDRSCNILRMTHSEHARFHSRGNTYRRGKTHTTATIEKMRQAHLGKTLSAEAIAKMRAALTGRKLTLEHAARISAALQGNKNALGAQRSAATCEKLRLSQLGKKASAETLVKLRESHLGNTHSDATRKKMRVSQTLRRQREAVTRV